MKTPAREASARLRRNGHSRNGSFTEAVHLPKNNEGIPCQTHHDQKFRAEYKGKSPIDRNTN